MRTLRLKGRDSNPPCQETGRPQGQGPQGKADLDTDDGSPEAQDLGSLRVLPQCDPRRETDEGTHEDRRDRFTGEPDTRKRCKSGSGGGGWKRDAAGYPSLPTQTGSRTPTQDVPSPAAHLTILIGDL